MPPKTRITTILLLLSFLSSASLTGQYSPNVFYHLSMDDGLSRNEVTDIIQDQYGFIWMATHYGLNRYNGYTFTPFHHDPEDSTSLNSNDISILFEDQTGRLWIGGGNSGLNLFDKKNNRFIRYLSFLTGINGIIESEDGRLWIASASQGLFLFDPENPDAYLHYSPDMKNPDRFVKEMDLNAVLRTHHNEIWVGGASQGISILNPSEEGSSFEQQLLQIIASQEGQSLFISKLFQSSDHKIWIGSAAGLFCWDPNEPVQTRKIRAIHPFQEYSGPLPEVDISLLNYIMDITEDSHGNLWLSTPVGLVYMEASQTKYSFFFPNSSAPHALGGTGCRSLLIDNTHMLWVGTDNGISLLHPNALKFDQGMEQKISPPGVSPGEIWQIISLDQQYFLTSTGGLFRLRKNAGKMQYENLIDTNSTALLFDQKDQLYVGTVSSAGFYAVNLDDLSLTSFQKTHTGKDRAQMLGNSILDFEQDHTGKIWIAAMGGLNRYDPKTGRFKYYERISLEGETIYLTASNDLLIDRNKHLWVITTYGLALLPAQEMQGPLEKTLSFIPLIKKEGTERSLRTNALQIAYESRDGTIWIGTNVGLHSASFDGDSIHIQRHNLRNEAVEPSVMSILEDDMGRLWVGTSNAGLFKYDPKTGDALNISDREGIFSNSFKFRNAFKDPSGQLVFVNEKKVLSFFPDSIQSNSLAPKLYLTDLILSGKNGSQRLHQYLNKPLKENELLTIQADQRMVQIQFTGLDFLNPEKVKYAYRLKGSGNDFVPLGYQREITFINLAPKTYQLEIIAWNSEGKKTENPLLLTLKVKPPFYLTGAAYLFYLFLAGSLAYGFFLFQLKRRDATRLKKLNDLKNRFITNITHQLKTPLTIINGQTSQILKRSDQISKSQILTKIAAIQGQGEELKKLIMQFLDLKELDVGLRKVNLYNGDLAAFIQTQLLLHESMAKAKNLQITFHSDKKVIRSAFDPELLSMIFNNLLTNAIKYTPEGGQVHVFLEQSKESNDLKLSVQDTGMGISKDELPAVFDLFYRTKTSEQAQIPGTGIGLAMVKEIVDLLGGSIDVISSIHQGSTFSVRLPYLHAANEFPALNLSGNNSNDIQAKTKKASNQKAKHHDYLADKPSVLLIEDHPEMQQYLADCLGDEFQLIQAMNGNKGIELAVEQQPDLIICDVMMPGMSGTEVCSALKQLDTTRHIPIILLTAKADLPSQKTGILSGADLYLAKPFDEEQLLFWMKNILQRQKQMANVYSSPRWLAKHLTEINQMAAEEQEFLHNLLSFIQKNIQDPDLNIPQIAKALNKGERSLHRDFKKLTGQPLKSFILDLRMDLAKELLLTSELTVEQIALQVGYKSLSAFSRAFKNRNSTSPIEFRASES